MRFILIFLYFAFSSFAYAHLLIAPTRVDVDGSKTTTREIIVENSGDDPVRLEITPEYLHSVNENAVRNNPNIESIEKITDKIRISPPVIRHLKPNQRRTIRVQILASEMEGEYRSYLKFSPIPIESKEPKSNESKSNVDSTATSININMIFHSYIPVYQTKGTAPQDVSFDCGENIFSITNHSKYQFNAWLESSTSEPRKILLFRESTLNLNKNSNDILSIKQSGSVIYTCNK